jgi:hypothetical protein
MLSSSKSRLSLLDDQAACRGEKHPADKPIKTAANSSNTFQPHACPLSSTLASILADEAPFFCTHRMHMLDASRSAAQH